MYGAFDGFMSGDTWFTGHPSDKRTFFQVLHTVVYDEGFDPEAMREYMKAKVNPVFHDAINGLVQDAWAVVEYLKATGAKV